MDRKVDKILEVIRYLFWLPVGRVRSATSLRLLWRGNFGGLSGCLKSIGVHKKQLNQSRCPLGGWLGCA